MGKMTKHHDIIELWVVCKWETDKAILVSADAAKEPKDVWLPKSQVEINERGKKREMEISLPEWLAKQKELI